MARKRGKKALYEVMSKARKKPGFGRTLEKMRPKKPVPKKDEPVTNKKSAADVETSKTAAKWWRKPRVVQFNVGRVEFSMPYQLGVALVLGSVLLIVAAFRLGQMYYVTDTNQKEPAENIMKPTIQEKPVAVSCPGFCHRSYCRNFQRRTLQQWCCHIYNAKGRVDVRSNRWWSKV